MTQEDYSGYQFDPEEDEGSLSDLDEDINQYIATTAEVEFYPPPPPHTHTQLACPLILKCFLVVYLLLLLCTGGAETSSHEPAH